MRLLLILFFTLLSFSQSKLSIESIMSEPFQWGYRVSNYAFTPNGEALMYKERKKAVQLFNISTQEVKSIDSLKAIPRTWIDDQSFIQKRKNRYYDATFDALQNKLIYDSKAYGSDQLVSYTASKKHRSDLILQENILHISRNGTLSVLNLGEKSHRYRVAKISDSGRFLIVLKSKRRDERNWNLYFPNYLPQFTKAGKQNRGINRNQVILVDLDKLKKSTLFSQKEGGFIANINFYKDEHLAFTNHPIDRRKVSFHHYDLKKKRFDTFYNSISNKWVVGSYHSLSFSPNGKKLLFIALSNGNEKIFVRHFSERRNRLISKEAEEVIFADWLDNRNIIYCSNFPNPTERYLYTINISNKKKGTLKTSSGFIKAIQINSSKTHLAYQFSSIAKPDELFVYDIKNQREYKLTQTVPKSFEALNLKAQEIIKTKSADQKFDIYANFYSSDKSKKPLVVFVHGAGIMQNVRNGWTPYYYREFMFHQFLIQNGYHVLDVDYRGSKGYSSRFSSDVHSHLGKKELEDIVTFVDKLDAEGLIDRNKVGIYGGSYGGFMAAYAMEFEADLFKAGAALRSVFKWENYFYTNEWYTRARLGLLKDNPSWYKRSSPLYHSDKIKNPLLILHGVLDDNVPFQDAAQMIQEMINHQKKFDLMIYPNEKHSFKKAKSWIDEYKRIYAYFELYLKGSK